MVGYVTGGPDRAPALPIGGGTASTGPNLAAGYGSPSPRPGSRPATPAPSAEFSHFAYDDPIVYPNQRGKSHLHMFFGNTGTNAASTYDLPARPATAPARAARRTARGTGRPRPHNGDGKLLIPDFITVYYKGNGPNVPQIVRSGPSPPG